MFLQNGGPIHQPVTGPEKPRKSQRHTIATELG